MTKARCSGLTLFWSITSTMATSLPACRPKETKAILPISTKRLNTYGQKDRHESALCASASSSPYPPLPTGSGPTRRSARGEPLGEAAAPPNAPQKPPLANRNQTATRAPLRFASGGLLRALLPARPNPRLPPGPAAGPGAGGPPPISASERERRGEAPPAPGPAVSPTATRPHHDGRPRAEKEGGTRAGRKPPSSRYCACAEATFCSPDAERLRRTPSPARGRSGMAARQYACAALCRTEEGRGPARHRGVAERLRQLSALAVVDVYDDRDGHVVYILQDFIL